MSTIARAPRASLAAVALGALALGLGLASVPLGLLAGQPVDRVVVEAVGVVPTAVVATVLAARRPRNPIGWILLGLSLRRVQHAVDRRFNRARYNAEAIVAAFTALLRQTVDLHTAQGDLAGVVHEAFQPTHVSVWLAATRQQASSSARPAAS